MLAKTYTETKYIYIIFSIFKTFVFKIHYIFFQVKPMKLSLVKKNILKSTGYKCYCTGMKQKLITQDHVTDQKWGKRIPSI